MASAAPIDPALHTELEAVFALYSALVPYLNPDTGLGGKLLYAGELDRDGSRLVRAANIAGAASLSATADPAAQRSAIREGVVDFLVTSLDEALRILKNEIRKRNAVAVGVSVAVEQVRAEMLDRGVLPDLLRPGSAAELVEFVTHGAQGVSPASALTGPGLIVLHSPPAGFESRALELIPETDYAARRWLRLSSRYLGPAARRLRSVPRNDLLAGELRAAN